MQTLGRTAPAAAVFCGPRCGARPCALRAARAARAGGARLARTGGGAAQRRRCAPAAALPQQQQQQQQQEVDYFASDKRPIILFDGVCNLCNTGVNIVLDFDKDGAFRMAALQSAAGRRLLARSGRSPDDISSIVLVEERRAFVKSEAVRRIGAALGVPFPLLAALVAPVPLPLRDFLYDQVAANRYDLFGRTPACRLGDAGAFAGRFISD
ncbi:MAG: hypothetical protein J3K34DRAFT_227810 [Monoraphidium minutum]|nr:MAG: hypothetical protein J3K34DRAFT_227810 [Monoraphidium minutum]